MTSIWRRGYVVRYLLTSVCGHNDVESQTLVRLWRQCNKVSHILTRFSRPNDLVGKLSDVNVTTLIDWWLVFDVDVTKLVIY